MTAKDCTNPVDLIDAKGLRAAVDRQGFSFQYAVLAECERCNIAGRSPWSFESTEVPVQVEGSDTRADFVLRYSRGTHYIVAECKRVNPALSRWAFLRAPRTQRNLSHHPFIADQFFPDNGQGGYLSNAHEPFTIPTERVAHVGIVAPAQRTHGDDSSGSDSRRAIEDAATQVCRASNGLLELMLTGRVAISWRGLLLPVIFTTASLWLCDTDLGESNLKTGKLPDSAGFAEVPWLFYQYNVSLGLKATPRLMPGRRPGMLQRDDFAHFTRTDAMRTIAVVSAGAIGDFLANFNPDHW